MPLGDKNIDRINVVGGKATTVEEWLALSSDEVAVLDMKIRLGEEFRARRRKNNLSQESAAKILKTSQGRVSKLEKGRATIDQLARSVLALGGSIQEVGRAISGDLISKF